MVISASEYTTNTGGCNGSPITTIVLVSLIVLIFLVTILSPMIKKQAYKGNISHSDANFFITAILLLVFLPVVGVIFFIVGCVKRSKKQKYIRPKRAEIHSNTKKDNNDDIFTILSDGICPPDPQKKQGDKVMDNNFNIKDYFRKDYGLPPKPPVFQLKGLLILLYLLIIPIIIKIVNANRIAEWENNYSIRNNTWHAKFDEFYNKFIEDMNIKETAMAKLGLDSSQIGVEGASQVEPIELYSKAYNGYWRKAPDGIFRTDVNEYTWIFFTEEQLLTYRVRFSLTGDPLEINGDASKQEFMNEFFYNDIVSVYTKTSCLKLDESKSYEKPDKEEKKDENDISFDDEEVKTESFSIAVPGETIGYAYIASHETTASLNGMKRLIRNKKNESEVRYLERIEKVLVEDIATRMTDKNN